MDHNELVRIDEINSPIAHAYWILVCQLIIIEPIAWQDFDDDTTSKVISYFVFKNEKQKNGSFFFKL